MQRVYKLFIHYVANLQSQSKITISIWLYTEKYKFTVKQFYKALNIATSWSVNS